MLENILKKIFGTQNERILERIHPTVDRVNALESSIRPLSDDRLAAKIAEFRQRVANGEPLDDLLPETFAVVREAGKRFLEMRHFDVQLIGGVILHEGRIAEMRTGEGKTLVATLPIVLNALTGRGVHLVTVNDYLARRDADWMGRLYRVLGMSVGVIVHGMDDTERQASYRCDITYGTNNEFGFDYLRDNMKFRVEDMVQRDLHYAIVDEVDSILIDEARTPLIISGPAEESTSFYGRVNSVIPFLKKDVDYTVDEKARQVLLTEDAGIPKLERLLSVDNLYDPANIEVLHHVNQALKAHILFHRDVDYMVKDGEVVIVDEFTGRLMPGRRWSDGLHQAVEAKEGVKIENENQTLATITFQNYFRMLRQAGRHDRDGRHRGGRVPADLQPRRVHHADEPADGPQGPVRPDLPDGEGEVPRGLRGGQGAARAGTAGPGGHRLHREIRAALRGAHAPRRTPQCPERQAPRAGGADHRRGGTCRET